MRTQAQVEHCVCCLCWYCMKTSPHADFVTLNTSGDKHHLHPLKAFLRAEGCANGLGYTSLRSPVGELWAMDLHKRWGIGREPGGSDFLIFFFSQDRQRSGTYWLSYLERPFSINSGCPPPKVPSRWCCSIIFQSVYPPGVLVVGFVYILLKLYFNKLFFQWSLCLFLTRQHGLRIYNPFTRHCRWFCAVFASFKLMQLCWGVTYYPQTSRTKKIL